MDSAELTGWQAWDRFKAEQAKPQPGMHRFNPALNGGL
jgi:hypothetical protein